MDKTELRFENFLSDIDPAFAEAVTQLHDYLVENGCAVKLQAAKSGHVVSFAEPGTGKVLANLVSRKKGPVVRIYGDHIAARPALLEALPEDLFKAVAKASACRRMLDPAKCNARCPMGYNFTVRGERYQKCRYNCFLFPIGAGGNPHLLGLLEAELKGRTA